MVSRGSSYLGNCSPSLIFSRPFSNMIKFSWKPEETFPGLFNSSFWFERKRSSGSGGADDQTWRETEEKEGNQRIIRIIRAWRETEEGLQEAL